MANPWFRMYAEFANDPKVQMLSETDQRRYIMVLCIRCNGEVTLHDEEIAFQLRIQADDWIATKRVLVGKNLITDGNQPTGWDKRQYLSDSSTARVAKHRAVVKSAGNVAVTPQIQNRTDPDSVSDPKQKVQKANSATHFDAQAHLVSIGVASQTAGDWLKLRKEKRASLTQTAINAVEREAAKAGISLQAAIEQCCKRGWVGFEAAWLNSDQQRQPRRITSSRDAEREATSITLTGRKPNELPLVERDITGEAYHVE